MAERAVLESNIATKGPFLPKDRDVTLREEEEDFAGTLATVRILDGNGPFVYLRNRAGGGVVISALGSRGGVVVSVLGSRGGV